MSDSPPSEQPLPLVVEFQKVELSRLLRDNARLNKRFDHLMEELRHLREMQQREQVLRQRDQALRQEIQDLLRRLAHGHPALESSATPVRKSVDPDAPTPAPVAPTPVISHPPNHGGGPAPDPERQFEPRLEARPESGISDSLDSATAPEPSYAYALGEAEPGNQAAGGATPGSAGSGSIGDARGSAGVSGAEGTETAELSALLADIGASLRELDPAASGDERSPPDSEAIQPDPASPVAASAPISTPPPAPRPTSASAAPGSSPSWAEGARRVPTEPAGPSGDDDASLLEILGRMGPSAEDRRTAARLMKRLLKGRGAGRRHDADREPE